MKERKFSMGILPCVLHGMALCAAVSLLTGCTGEEDGTMPGKDGRVALEVSSGIDVQTRAHDETWETGDAIGIYMLDGETVEAGNREYTTASTGKRGDFAAAAGQTVYFPVDGSARDFISYYPHRTLPESNLYTVDVGRQSVQKDIDLMGSGKATGKTKDNPGVQFEFRHKLVKLYLIIKPDGTSLSAGDMEGLGVSITNQKTQATYDVVKGGDVAVGTEGNAATTIELLTDAKGTKSEGIVLPNSSTGNMLFGFHLKNGTTFTWAINKAAQSQQFTAGNKYVYAITIGKTAVEVTSSVTDWTPGNGGGETGNAE